MTEKRRNNTKKNDGSGSQAKSVGKGRVLSRMHTIVIYIKQVII